MYCSQCGQLIKNESAAFCAYCGSKLPVVTDAAETAAELKKSQENNDVIKDDIIDLDATVRVDDIPGKKYTLDHNQFRMPEPQEENVFDITPDENKYDENATIKGRYAPAAGAYTYSSGQAPVAEPVVNSYRVPDSQDFSQSVGSFSVQGNFPESFTQAGNGPDNFFVQQTPVSVGSESKKKMPASRIVLLIVICVLLFAAAVTGGIFAASAVMDNLMLVGASALAQFHAAAVIYI